LITNCVPFSHSPQVTPLPYAILQAPCPLSLAHPFCVSLFEHRGLGSSSAAIVAGLISGLVLAGHQLPCWGKEELLQLAASIEGTVNRHAYIDRSYIIYIYIYIYICVASIEGTKSTHKDNVHYLYGLHRRYIQPSYICYIIYTFIYVWPPSKVQHTQKIVYMWPPSKAQRTKSTLTDHMCRSRGRGTAGGLADGGRDVGF
jgi:hypothetical protein